jgi:hypothetical protein
MNKASNDSQETKINDKTTAKGKNSYGNGNET